MSILRKSLAISVLFLLSLALMLATVPYVKALGTIRIWPPLPTMLDSPATFQINVTEHDTYDPYILLVMTNASYHGLTDDVTVSWNGKSITFSSDDFEKAESGKVPPSSTTEEGCRYTVASLRSHLGVPETEPVYWVNGSFLWTSVPGDGSITEDPQTFTVTLPSSAPRMLVYALGKAKGAELFNNKVPPTIPGFVIPELGTILLATASFSALALYALQRRKHFH